MAMLMVHLLAAQRWARQHEQYLKDPDFYLGAISPDAIHIRDKDDKSDKNRIHLYNWMSLNIDEVIRYWSGHGTPFDIGYGIHVLTDAQWVPRFKARAPQLLFPDGKTDVKAYYSDVYATDYRLYHKMGKELFDMTARGRAPEDHPLLTAFEISQWQKEKCEEYRNSPFPENYAEYLDEAYVMDFITDAQLILEETYRRYKK